MSAPICQAAKPMSSGRICASCYPGVDWPEGHGVCATHQAQMMADAGLSLPQRRDVEAARAAAQQSPKENP